VAVSAGVSDELLGSIITGNFLNRTPIESENTLYHAGTCVLLQKVVIL